MGKKVEKSCGRAELADFLDDLSQQVRRGKLETESGHWTLPAQMDFKIHYKEEDGNLVAKISWSWPHLGEYRPVAGEAAPAAKPSFKDVKSRLSTCFKELQRVLTAGMVPEKQAVVDFVNYAQIFAAYGKPEWQNRLSDFMTHVKNLQHAVESQQLEAMQEELQVLVNSMIVCHREFK